MISSQAQLISSFAVVMHRAIVDVGTGTGMFAEALSRYCSPKIVVGIDPSPAMLRQARRRSGSVAIHYLTGDGCRAASEQSPVRSCAALSGDPSPSGS